MKKKVLGFIAFAAIAAVAGWNITQSEKEDVLSDLAFDNIEALAQGEVYIEFICIGSYYECHTYSDGETLWGIKQSF